MSALPSVHPSDDLDDQELYPGIRNVPHRQRRASQSHKQSLAADKLPLKTPRELAEQSDTSDAFAFTYTAARHEAQWLLNSLGEFYEGQWIDDVLRLVKGGKEANVYQCAANETATGLHNGFVAAKVYRPRKLRNLKNDHLYREGRTDLDADGRAVNDDGMLHAMAKRTEYGRELLHISWIEHEVKTMEVLHAAGADVPRPLSSANNAILMGFVGDEDGGAPALSSVNLGLKKARRLFERVVHNLELMLANDRIHADLSAFNILYWQGEITLIDFPQAIQPGQNRNAYRIFERDVQRVCEYFTQQGVRSEPRGLAAGLWKAQHHSLLPDVHPALLDPEDDRDRRLWRQAGGRGG